MLISLLMPCKTIITRTTKKGKVLEFEIDVGLRDDMKRSIRKRFIHNLEATQRFLELKEKKYDDICAGVYTYAVEEYGKILFLSALNPTSTNNQIPIQYTDEKQGFLIHRHKIDLALNALPDSCKVLREGGFMPSGFTSSGFITALIADFEARKSIFFVDFNKDDKSCSIVMPPKVKRKSLVTAVNDFLKFIRRQKYP